MKSRVRNMLLIAAGGVVIILALLWSYLTTHNWDDFGRDFLANFLSDFVIGALLLGILNLWREQQQKPEGEIIGFIVVDSPNDAIPQEQVRLLLNNMGIRAFSSEEIAWHVFIALEDFGFATDQTPREWRKPDAQGHAHFSAVLTKPVFHSDPVSLFEMIIRHRSKPVYYYLSTVYGSYPDGVKTDRFGEVDFMTLGKISIVATTATMKG